MGGALAPGSHARPLGLHSFSLSGSFRIVPLHDSLRIRSPKGGSEKRPALMRRAFAGLSAAKIRREKEEESILEQVSDSTVLDKGNECLIYTEDLS